jgi:hypothetical protein
MDPSLIDIIAQATRVARLAGHDSVGQRRAAEQALGVLLPTLSAGTIGRIVEQLYTDEVGSDLGVA